LNQRRGDLFGVGYDSFRRGSHSYRSNFHSEYFLLIRAMVISNGSPYQEFKLITTQGRRGPAT
jgi:hypothetical protein